MPHTPRELAPTEFPLDEKLWTQYRGQKADSKKERIFGVFVDGNLAATSRCNRHFGRFKLYITNI